MSWRRRLQRSNFSSSKMSLTRLQDTFKTSSRRRLENTSWRHLEDILKTPFVFIFRRRLENVFKTSWSRRIYSPALYVLRRCLQDVKSFEDVFKMYHQVKLLLRTCLQDVFKTFSKRIQHVLETHCKVDYPQKD